MLRKWRSDYEGIAWDGVGGMGDEKGDGRVSGWCAMGDGEGRWEI